MTHAIQETIHMRKYNGRPSGAAIIALIVMLCLILAPFLTVEAQRGGRGGGGRGGGGGMRGGGGGMRGGAPRGGFGGGGRPSASPRPSGGFGGGGGAARTSVNRDFGQAGRPAVGGGHAHADCLPGPETGKTL